jgi:hypothetical protein
MEAPSDVVYLLDLFMVAAFIALMERLSDTRFRQSLAEFTMVYVVKK